MKNILVHLSQKLDEAKVFLKERKDGINVKKLEHFRISVLSEFEKTLALLEMKKNSLTEAFLQKGKHKKFRVGVFQMLMTSRLKLLIAAPFIYMMLPVVFFFHICLEIYQQTAFRLCEIPLVKHRDHFIFDRHHLAYLNILEKINCLYCGYFNGLIEYAREIGGKTERFWCPIKHAKRTWDPHQEYGNFFEYLDAEGYRKKRLSLRKFPQKYHSKL